MFERLWSEAAAGSPPAARHVLGTVGFGVGAASPGWAACHVQTPLAAFAGRAWVDVWDAVGPAHTRRIAGVALATDGSTAFGSVAVDESVHGGLRAATLHAYTSIFGALDRVGYPFPLRFWNYVPRINAMLDGLERYRHFNIGRQEAFLRARRPAFAGAPAACAIGAPGGPLHVHFLAAASAPAALENPRQVSAYHYPSEYGPRAPTFSRATLAAAGATTMLFVSGTASVVGHRSEHPGDAVAQTRETFVNLSTLIDAANARAGANAFALGRLIYTIYVRHAHDVGPVRRVFEASVGAASAAARSAVLLQGDICRAELLVEIEATGCA